MELHADICCDQTASHGLIYYLPRQAKAAFLWSKKSGQHKGAKNLHSHIWPAGAA